MMFYYLELRAYHSTIVYYLKYFNLFSTSILLLLSKPIYLRMENLQSPKYMYPCS